MRVKEQPTLRSRICRASTAMDTALLGRVRVRKASWIEDCVKDEKCARKIWGNSSVWKELEQDENVSEL